MVGGRGPRRTLTALALHGYAVDSVIANRLLPPEAGRSAWGAAWREAQAAALADAGGAERAGAARRRTGPSEPVGLAALLRSLGETVYGTDDPLAPAPAAVGAGGDPGRGRVRAARAAAVRARSEVRLARSGDELVLTVGDQLRRLALPSVLRRCVAVGASAGDGAVRVRFRPDPALWPREA